MVPARGTADDRAQLSSPEFGVLAVI